MYRLAAACVCVLFLAVSGCGEKSAGGGGGDGVSKGDFKALEARVAALEKQAASRPAGTAAAADPDLAKKVAELEAAVRKVAAGGGSGGGGLTAALPAIGVMNDKKNIWQCVKVEKGPTIDGKLDDEAWKKAVQVKLVSDEGKRVANDTGVLICHDGTNFYIGAVCMESEMDKLHIKCTERDQKVYGDDCVEFYIDAEFDRTDAVKFVVNPDGVFMDFLRDLDGDAGDVTWNAQVKTTKLDDRYYMEIAVPLKDMGLKYKAGMQIGFNAYRMRQGAGKMGEYCTWWGECNKIASIGKVTFE